MSTPFDAAMTAANTVIEAVFGERFLWEPQAAPERVSGRRDVNAGPVASSYRAAVPFTGCLISPGAEEHAQGRRMAASATRTFVSDKPMIDVAEAALPGGARQNDRILRAATGEVFLIADVKPGDLGRLWLILNRGETRPEQPR